MAFHIELRQFPHSARAFNLERPDLDGLLGGWLTGRPVSWGEREWEPRKATLTVLKGPPLPTSALGMGRGWQEAGRSATEVTDEVLAQARTAVPVASGPLREALLERCAQAPVPLAALVAVGAGEPASAVERAVWSLLVAGELELVRRPVR